ncbi:MAG: GtrA family protein [Rhizobiaceae bacterium]|nr:GtrA family protein [Rhizobiaceae bacterium]
MAARRTDAAMALAGAAGSLLVSWLQGANKLVRSGGDSDSLMRLVQVRDLLAGQGWFDLVQLRMGLEPGFELHWSRLVDAPIAILIAAIEEITGDGPGSEAIAAYLWPGLLLALSLYFTARASRTMGGAQAAFPAVVLALAALHFMGIFVPGSFDHHNVQLALVLGMASALLGRPGSAGGAVSGTLAALSLAVGMETAPLVAAGAAALALCFLVSGHMERLTAAGFGLGFAAAAFIVTLVTLPPREWASVECDAWSGAQAGTAILTGLGLAACALVPALCATARRRAFALASLGAVTLVVALVAFPACLADPYASLDPLLKRYWLDWVSEAQGVLSLFAGKPGEAAGYFATPVLALAFLAWCAVSDPASRRNALVLGAMIACAAAVSLWQVRGAIFSVALAAIPLAALIARARALSVVRGGSVFTLLLVFAWLVSFNVVWNMGAARLADLLSKAPPAANAAAGGDCNAATDYTLLSGLSPATVLVISNLGAAVLANTDHRVLAGPYHRNVEGNLAALRALASPPEAARSMAAEFEIDLVAHCPGNDETRTLSEAFPSGLLAALSNGQPPDWLQPIESGQASNLEIFRVVRGH